MNDQYQIGRRDMMDHACDMIEETPARIWPLLPDRLFERADSLTSQTHDPARICGILDGLAICLRCVLALPGRRAWFEIKSSM